MGCFKLSHLEEERRGIVQDEIVLGSLKGNPMAKDICPGCGERAIFWSLYKGDTLFGEGIPRNGCLRVCSDCGYQRW